MATQTGPSPPENQGPRKKRIEIHVTACLSYICQENPPKRQHPSAVQTLQHPRAETGPPQGQNIKTQTMQWRLRHRVPGGML